MSHSIQHSFFYPNTPNQVWACLTKSELLEQWLMKNNFKPVVGHDFHFWTNPMPNFGFDGTIYCKVLEVIPYKKLSYSRKGGPGDGNITLDSIVIWTLEPKDGGTYLYLEHNGFKEVDFNMYSIMDYGWQKNMKEISGFINTETYGNTKS